MGALLWLAVLLCASSTARAVGVHVSVRAKWEGTSLLLEAGELLAKERNDLYWRFLEQWLATDEFVKYHTERECVQYIEEKGSSLLGAPLSPLFRLSLSLRSASPKLVLYQQLASESLALLNSGIKIPEKFVRKFLMLPEASEQGAMRLDYRSDEHVHYLNNIEEDSRYKRWRANLNEMLMPVFPGQMRYVRKNLFHAIYVIDPATPKGLMVVEAFSLLYENNYPMRFGVILLSGKVLEHIVANGPDGISKYEELETDLSLLVTRLFLFIKEEYDDKELPLNFLTNISTLLTSFHALSLNYSFLETALKDFCSICIE